MAKRSCGSVQVWKGCASLKTNVASTEMDEMTGKEVADRYKTVGANLDVASVTTVSEGGERVSEGGARTRCVYMNIYMYI